MHYSPITAAPPLDLFSLESWTDAPRPTNDKPRCATEREVRAYVKHLAAVAGLYPFDAAEIVRTSIGREPATVGMTFGKLLKAAGGEYVEVPCFETLTVRKEYRQFGPTYEEGAYSMPMPGRLFRDVVTMETLNEAGEVAATSTLPTDGKRQVAWSRAAVRAAAGPMPKAKRKRKATQKPMERFEAASAVEQPESPEPAPVPAPAQDMAAIEAPGPVEPAPDMVEQLLRRVEALEARLAAPAEELAAPAVEKPVRASRAVRERLVRRYLAMRAERARLIEQRAAWRARADEANQRARDMAAARDEVVEDCERLERERDQARAALSTAAGDAERKARDATNRAAAMEKRLEEMTGRAIRAEQALQLYRVQATVPVSFGGMTGARVDYGAAR